LSDFHAKCTSIETALKSFRTLPDPSTLANAVKLAQTDDRLQSYYIDKGMPVMMMTPAGTPAGQIEMMATGLKAVAGMSAEAADRFNKQSVAVMANAQSGIVAYKVAQTALELQGVNMEDVNAHGFVCRDFSFSTAGAGRSPILFVPETQIFARQNGFIGPAQAFADNAKQTARKDDDVEFAKAVYRHSVIQLGAREWLPTVPQAVTLLQEKVQGSAAARTAPPALRRV